MIKARVKNLVNHDQKASPKLDYGEISIGLPSKNDLGEGSQRCPSSGSGFRNFRVDQ